MNTVKRAKNFAKKVRELVKQERKKQNKINPEYHSIVSSLFDTDAILQEQYITFGIRAIRDEKLRNYLDWGEYYPEDVREEKFAQEEIELAWLEYERTLKVA